MDNRKPFKLRKTIVFYNFLQAVFSFYLFYEEGRISWFGKYNFRCQAVDTSTSDLALRVKIFQISDSFDQLNNFI